MIPSYLSTFYISYGPFPVSYDPIQKYLLVFRDHFTLEDLPSLWPYDTRKAGAGKARRLGMLTVCVCFGVQSLSTMGNFPFFFFFKSIPSALWGLGGGWWRQCRHGMDSPLRQPMPFVGQGCNEQWHCILSSYWAQTLPLCTPLPGWESIQRPPRPHFLGPHEPGKPSLPVTNFDKMWFFFSCPHRLPSGRLLPAVPVGQDPPPRALQGRWEQAGGCSPAIQVTVMGLKSVTLKLSLRSHLCPIALNVTKLCGGIPCYPGD